ncbi:2-hydroxy-6-oxo-2,4-heptadienoate hydrolase [Methylibium sp. Pch-M]|uniref:alpha/beta fold hydrolase n=1 Tax=Methylibium sp. Pch-M TaxID=2082386 RepID=UPI00101077C3|nr:alpha/beta fold hydrolase [Methylibium sp. Pch-M]QAZ40703.1 2-hydroxy-6-oxo-2,4-heptadienoate hydrolase [Methylibium sp. Pch-M]
MSSANPEIGKKVRTGGFDSNVHDQGASAPGQPPVLFVHGSGPGVSAWANWRLVLPRLATQRRVVAPDMLGFGYTDRPQPADQSGVYTMDAWVQQAVDLLDALDIAQADLVGNSFGGALSLALAIRHPQRVRRLVLMGSVGVRFPITPGLDAVWGYTPSFENMRRIMDVFAFDRGLVNDELAKLRYEASIRPGFQESFGAMFPAPRQRWVDALASPEAAIRALPHSTLVIHGRDDQVIPMSTSLTLAQWIPDAQLHLFGRCGHWTQIEHTERFVRLVSDFLAEADAAA